MFGATTNRIGPSASAAARSASESATGDQTNSPPSRSRITAMRVGYRNPATETVSPEASQIDGANEVRPDNVTSAIPPISYLSA